MLDTVRRWFGSDLVTSGILGPALGGGSYLDWRPDYALTVNGQPVDSSWVSLSTSPAELWLTQPHLRTVVSFLGRNVAQLGLHVFERVGDDDRRRDRTSPLARLLRRPSETSTLYETVFALVVDDALYDAAYLAVVPDPSASSGWSMVRLPPAWVTPRFDSAFTVREYVVQAPRGKKAVLPASDVWALHGYHPTDPRKGSAAIQSLVTTLEESLNAARYRNRTWERGGRVQGVLQRPPGAPRWTDDARRRFKLDWQAKYGSGGSQEGGTPILEDGMTLERIDYSASDQQFVEGIKLSFAMVASAFHVNPTMVGLLDNANYSNVREFRRALYGDTLGPIMAKIEDRLNAFLLPMLGMDPDRFYVEFNIAEKLQGNFEEQTLALQASVGRPWMTANEARARFNLSALDGDADQLITPLNVIAGGQASPRDSAPNKP